MISLSLSLHNNPRGRGFWNFNGSLRQHTNYVTLVKKVIDETVVINTRYSERPDLGQHHQVFIY